MVKSLKEKTIVEEKISLKDINRTSDLYSSLDVAKAMHIGFEPLVATKMHIKLKKKYQRVIRFPQDTKSRLDLASEQIGLKIPYEAVYHLNQAEKYVADSDTAKLAQIYLIKGVTYFKLDKRKKAEEQFQKAKNFDSKVFEKVDRKKLHINSSLKRHIELIPLSPKIISYSQNDLFQLLKKNQVEKAINEFKKRIEGPDANSKDYYGLAICYKRNGNNRGAISYAQKALSLTKIDRKLSTAEVQVCKRLVSLKSINRN